MKSFLTFFLFLLSTSIIAQSSGNEAKAYVQGKVFDQKDQEPIIGTSVRALQQN